MARSYRHISAGLNLVPQDGSNLPSAGGDLAVSTIDGKVHFFNASVGTSSSLVTEAHPCTLTNKSIDGLTNTLTNIPISSLSPGYIIPRASIAPGSASYVVINDGAGVLSQEATLAKTRGGSGQDNSSITFPASGTLVTTSGSATLTNKTMDGGSNTFTNLADGSLATSYIKADGTRALTANWNAGAFSGTFNSVQVGSAANRITGLATIVNTGTLTLPTATDTLVGRATTDTLTNKTMSGASNTFTAIPVGSLSSGAATNGQILTANGSGGAAYADPAAVTRNYFINGAVDFDQQRGGTILSPVVTGVPAYFGDNFKVSINQVNIISGQTVADVPTASSTIPTFSKSVKVAAINAAGMGGGTFCAIASYVEGYDYAVLKNQAVTLSFYVKAHRTGTYCIAFQNNGSDRSYVIEYTISAADTWEKKTVTLTLNPSGGTDSFTTGVGLAMYWAIGAGATFQTTANAWQTGNFYATSNQTNGIAANTDTFQITGVMLNLGSTASSFQRAGGNIQGELAMCQRYYEVMGAGCVGKATSTTQVSNSGFFKVTKRTSPTVAVFAQPVWDSAGAGQFTASGSAFSANFTTTTGFTALSMNGFTGLTASTVGGMTNDCVAWDARF